jgi:activating signal cointegrator 1
MKAAHERSEHRGIPYCERCGTGWPCPGASTLKALTLHQPWATFIAGGEKTIETRSWGTSYRGWLAIHAGSAIPSYLGLGRRGTIRIGDFEVEKDGPGQLLLRDGGLHWPYRLPLGGVIAVAELLDCVPMVDRNEYVGAPPCLTIGPSGLTLWTGGEWYRDAVRADVTGELPYGDFAPGRFAWVLGRVIRLTRPVPCAGHQGLWDLRRAGPDVVMAVEDRIGRWAA